MGKVLVVEDDILILTSSVDSLRAAGLSVLETETADAALAILQQDATSIALIFSDIETGGTIDGVGLAQRVAEMWPSITVILTSGRTSPPADDAPGIAHFIRKPYDLDHVCTLINELAAAPQRSH